jgi:ABC-2 family transporter protein
MRWYILRTLLAKETRRQLANRGGIALAALLVVAALLMTFFSDDNGQAGSLLGGLEHCFVDYGREDAWVTHLKENVAPELRRRIIFRNVSALDLPGQTLVYPPGAGAIQLRTATDAGGRVSYRVALWHPGQDGSSLAVYEAWFWRESARFFQREAAVVLEQNGQGSAAVAQLPEIAQERARLSGTLDVRSSLTTALVLFALFFFCVYLLPSLTCEERERGVLLAQALSPASPLEILAAKFLFYPAAGIALAALLAGIARPDVLARPFFWLVVAVAAVGSLGIGMTIACLARTQRTASMGALCYMLAVAMLLFICQQGRIPLVSNLALEYHVPRMLHAVLNAEVHWFHWLNLAAAATLAVGWSVLATMLFRRRGWQ